MYGSNVETTRILTEQLYTSPTLRAAAESTVAVVVVHVVSQPSESRLPNEWSSLCGEDPEYYSSPYALLDSRSVVLLHLPDHGTQGDILTSEISVRYSHGNHMALCTGLYGKAG
jgi:hypothetical protein